MIKAGSDPFASLLECKVMFMDDSEMRSQLEKVCSAIHRGETESSAIDRFGDDIDFSEVALLREVLRLGRQEGASLGQALIRLARVTRQRQSFHRKARAALALQRLSSIGMFLCALCISVMQFLANPEAFWRALNHPVGSLFLGAGGLAVLLGLVWMLSLSRGRIGVC
jgi:Flp pilus assembly protein TadB